MAAAHKLEELPRNRRGEYGFKARIPGVAAKTIRARTKNEARTLALRWVDDVESGKERTSPEITLSEYWAEFVPGARWSPETRTHHQSVWAKHIAPRFADDPLSSIQRSHIRDWLSRLERAGVHPAARHNALVTLRVLLNSAKEDGRMDSSVPSMRNLLPAVQRRRGHALSPEQVQTLAAAVPPAYATIVLLGATTGLRIGELLALRPDDIDEGRLVVSVRRSVKSRTKASRRVGNPKTQAARRDVPITGAHVKLVRDHIAKFGLSTEGYLFTAAHRRGTWLLYGTFRDAFDRAVDRLVEEIDFPPVRIHDLRKTFGAYLVANPNVPLQEKHGPMGHSKLSTLLDIYAPLLQGPSALPAHVAAMAKRLELADGDEPGTAIEAAPPPVAARYVVATRICPVDGVEFRPRDARQVACSPRCTRLRINERAKLKMRAKRQRTKEAAGPKWWDDLVEYARGADERPRSGTKVAS